MEEARTHILLVDDEPALLRLMESFLKGLGYQIHPAGSAAEALRVFREDPGRFSLVVADVTMPDVSGKDLALDLLKINPNLLVLICSGYPFEVKSLPPEVQSCFGVLQKPFLPKMLAKSIESLLRKKDEVEPPASPGLTGS
ncbi:MAG: response regulator [Bryobacteraceae bacterium]